MWAKGYLQLYTGDGKGKTTCAVGLTIRAIGAGLKVAFFQFFKPDTSSEVKVLRSLSPSVFYQNYHLGGFVKDKPSEKLRSIVKQGWEEVKKIASSGEYNILVLDELTYALNWGIITQEELTSFLRAKSSGLEIIVTGRMAPQWLLDLADLVTEMKMVKHYLPEGVPARLGIEK